MMADWARSTRGLCAASVAVFATLVAAVSPVSASHGPRAHAGTTATFAVSAGLTPQWILPLFTPADYYYDVVCDFVFQMYRPLYSYGSGGQDVPNPSLSLANSPVYSDGGRTVTITLRSYRWSDGTPVTTRDVEFDFNLIRAAKSSWGPYLPGLFPDNVVRADWINTRRFSLTFNRAYNRTWLLANQLTNLIPLPQQEWDRTSLGGTVSNLDLTAAGARAVYQFLAKQAGTLDTYVTNPLWRVVDGPWELKAYEPITAESTFVANRAYSGPVKPTLTSFRLLTFTSDAAEFDALRSGVLDYGYLPATDLNQASYFKSHGYRLVPWNWAAINYMEINHTNPATKPLLNQLYIRQALEHLINQPQYIRTIYHGYARPDYGPVPDLAGSGFVTAAETRAVYPYSPAASQALLRDHGWTVRPGGVDSCRRPGEAVHDCGQGIHAGDRLTLSLLYGTGTEATSEVAQAFRSAASEAGINVQLEPHTVGELYSLNGLCPAAHPCNWDLVMFPGAIINFSPSYDYPTGEVFYRGYFWSGGYNSVRANQLIAASHVQSGSLAFDAYEAYLARQLPDLWLPVPILQMSVIRDNLHGTLPQSVLQEIYPENWSVGS